MNQALFLISLQHELSMSIGTELKLDAMLKTFLKVCLNRVHLSSCHVYLYQNSEQQPVKLEHSINSNLEHYISVPKRQNGALWQANPQLKAFEKSLKDNLSASYFEQKIDINGADNNDSARIYQNKLFAIARELEALKEEINKEYPKQAAAFYNTKYSKPIDVQQNISKEVLWVEYSYNYQKSKSS